MIARGKCRKTVLLQTLVKSRFLRAVCSYYHMFFFVIRDLPPVYRRKSESEDLEEITWIGEELE